MSRAIKSCLLPAVVLATALFSPDSQAFDLEGATIQGELLLPEDNEEAELTRLNPNVEDVKDHFNYANCVCGSVSPGNRFGAKIVLVTENTSFNDSENVEFWTGTSCDASPDNIIVRDDNCIEVGGVDDVEDLLSPQTIAMTVADLVAANGECDPTQNGTRQLYALIDEGSSGIDGEDIAEILIDVPFDLEPPPVPTAITLDGAENAIQINWDLPESRADDIRYFQVLCQRVDETDSPDDDFPGDYEAQYLTSQIACELDLDGAHPIEAITTTSARGPVVDAGTPEADAAPSEADAGTDEADAGPGPTPNPGIEALSKELNDLNPQFICGQAAGTDPGVRVEGLSNGVPYHVVLVAIDDYRNPSALYLGQAIPEEVSDGWEHYQDNGGNADGGFCFVATATFGNYDHPFVRILRNFRDDSLAHFAWGRSFIDWYYSNSPGLAGFIAAHPVARTVSYFLLAPLVAFAAICEYTGPLGKLALLLAFGLIVHLRRRRRAERGLKQERPSRPSTRGRRLVVATTAALALLAFSATANAQAYWDDYNEEIEVEDTTSRWNFEIKAGPYSPDVDASAGGNTPFADVFGSKWKVMTIFGLDRYFSFPSGQLGVTGTIGFSNRSASAFKLDAAGNPLMEDGEFVRSAGDSTSFRLMPTSLGAVYRFTRLDDDYGIPIVPYGKLALSYYLWWFTDPSGKTSEATTPSCPDAGMPGSECDGELGRGGSLGYQATLGIAIRAERLDPGAELSLRNEMGIEHAGFFVEVQLADVDGFGASDKLSVSDSTWFGGINFEF